MGLLFKIKTKIILNALEKKKKNEPFDLNANELHQLPEDAAPEINNSYYFGGNSIDGQSLIFRLGQRHSYSEVFILYTDKNRFLVSEKQEFPAGECPLSCRCIEPGKKWEMHFEGNLKDDKTGEIVPSKFDLTYTARLPIFDVISNGDFIGMAKSIAREKWTKEFFREAMSSDTGTTKGDGKKTAQHHYEQTGHINGTLILGNENVTIDLHAVRDHSYGKRDWDFMCDHIWLMAVAENGQTLNFSIVNYPRLKKIFVGYTDIDTDAQSDCKDAPQCISSLRDYKIIKYDHNNGLGPDEIIVECEYTNGKRYTVRAKRDANLLTPFANGKFYFQEGLGMFDINGVKARGTIEYGFNQNRNRWDPYE